MATTHRHPAWFGSVMGTGATSIVLMAQAEVWDLAWLSWAAAVLLLVASALAVLLAPRYARRLRRGADLLAELGDPGHGAMLATVPAGLLVLAVAWARVGPVLVSPTAAVWIDIVLALFGVLLALALGITWANAIASGTHDLSSVNGGWLIPPVMNLLVPLTIVPVMVRYPDQAPWLMVVAFAFYGIGVVLFLAVFTLLVARLALRPRQPAPMAPSLWIPLAPAGILGVALLRLLQSGEEVGLPGFSSVTAGVVVAAMGIGLGLWWALFAGVELVRLRRAGGIPFHPGWWGFVFPIAAMTLSIIGIGSAVDSEAIAVVGAVAAVILVLVWLLVGVRSLDLVRRRPAR